MRRQRKRRSRSGGAVVGKGQEGKEKDKEVSSWTAVKTFFENAGLGGATDTYEYCTPDKFRLEAELVRAGEGWERRRTTQIS